MFYIGTNKSNPQFRILSTSISPHIKRKQFQTTAYHQCTSIQTTSTQATHQHECIKCIICEYYVGRCSDVRLNIYIYVSFINHVHYRKVRCAFYLHLEAMQPVDLRKYHGDASRDTRKCALTSNQFNTKLHQFFQSDSFYEGLQDALPSLSFTQQAFNFFIELIIKFIYYIYSLFYCGEQYRPSSIWCS